MNKDVPTSTVTNSPITNQNDGFDSDSSGVCNTTRIDCGYVESSSINKTNRKMRAVNPPKFSGLNDEDVHLFIFQYEGCMRAAGLDEELWTTQIFQRSHGFSTCMVL